jgi:hypothetical protein
LILSPEHSRFSCLRGRCAGSLSERALFLNCSSKAKLPMTLKSSPLWHPYCEAQINPEIRRNCLKAPRRRTLPQRSRGTGCHPCGRVAARLLLFSSRGSGFWQDDAGASVSPRGNTARREGLLYHAFRDQTGVAQSGAITWLVARQSPGVGFIRR